MPCVDASTQTTARVIVDTATQTTLSGPPSYLPPARFPADTTTPPAEKADMPSNKSEMLNQDIPEIAETNPETPTGSPGRRKRPDLVARISIPLADGEGHRSPPPTHAILSPLPPMNKLHAGHTPLFPGHFSPAQQKEKSEPSTPTPMQDIALSGPLVLPAQPGDGAEDRIELKVLDAELQKIAQEQEEYGELAVATGSPGSIEVDGVILKKPKMNLGAPLGQA